MLRLSLWSVSFIFIFVSIFACSTSFVAIYFMLTLCFYQHEIVSMNLDLLKRIHVLDNPKNSDFHGYPVGKLSPAYGDVVLAFVFLRLREKKS